MCSVPPSLQRIKQTYIRRAMSTMKYSDRHLAGLSAQGLPTAWNSRRGLSRLRDRPQLRLRADKLPSPNHCVRDVISCWFSKLSLSLSIHPCFFAHDPLPCLVSFPCPCSFLAAPSRFDRRGFPGPDSQGNSRGNRRTSRCVSGSEPRV